MGKKVSQPKFEPGDRVAERPKASFIPGISAEAIERTAQYRTQRYGTVVDNFVKQIIGRNKVPTKNFYVRVLWDGMQTPSEHAQHRLILESELETVLDGYVENIYAKP